MSYKVLIKEISTGETLLCPQDLEWGEASLFWWTEGNFGCDCNRKLEFYRAKGIELEDSEVPCGESAYTVIKAIFENGFEIAIDG